MHAPALMFFVPCLDDPFVQRDIARIVCASFLLCLNPSCLLVRCLVRLSTCMGDRLIGMFTIIYRYFVGGSFMSC